MSPKDNLKPTKTKSSKQVESTSFDKKEKTNPKMDAFKKILKKAGRLIFNCAWILLDGIAKLISFPGVIIGMTIYLLGKQEIYNSFCNDMEGTKYS